MEPSDITVTFPNQVYDDLMFRPLFREFYEHSDFANYGYWVEGTTGLRQACENLVHRLLDRMTNKSGSILDVACGKGASTRYLLEHYPPEEITAINISERQLEAGRVNAPGVQFQCMDATRLEFPDATFGNVLCVESAFHFDTRGEFLAEAWRVLKPGGTLALSDILMTREAERSRAHRTEKNFLSGAEEYAELLRAVGFHNIHIEDATERCWRSFFRYTVNYMHEKFLRREIDQESLGRYLEKHYGHVNDVEYYLLVWAEK